jgi:hypothetical protein
LEASNAVQHGIAGKEDLLAMMHIDGIFSLALLLALRHTSRMAVRRTQRSAANKAEPSLEKSAQASKYDENLPEVSFWRPW